MRRVKSTPDPDTFVKSIAIHLPFLLRYFCKSMPSFLAESSIYTTNLYQTVSGSFCLFHRGHTCETSTIWQIGVSSNIRTEHSNSFFGEKLFEKHDDSQSIGAFGCVRYLALKVSA